MRSRLAVGLLLAGTGCAGMGWTHPSKPQSELPVDKYECEKETLAAYPPVLDREGKDLNELRRGSLWRGCLEARGWR